MKYSRENGERAYTEHRVNKRSVYDVASELGTSPPNVTRWCQRYERECPARARELVSGVPADGSSSFLERLRSEATAGDEIPGFEDETADDARESQKPPPADDDSADETGDAVDELRKALGGVKKLLKTETDPAVKARFASILAQLTNTLARVEAKKNEAANVLNISRDDIKATWDGLMAKIAVICSRPLVCEHCGKQMMVALAMQDASAEDEKK